MLAKWFLDASYDALDSLEHRGAFLPAFGRPAFSLEDTSINFPCIRLTLSYSRFLSLSLDLG